MTNASESLRSCPTRADGAEVLIAHSISGEICHERQRRLYHKCFTCAHLGQAASAGASALPPRSPLHRGATPPVADEALLIRRGASS